MDFFNPLFYKNNGFFIYLFLIIFEKNETSQQISVVGNALQIKEACQIWVTVKMTIAIFDYRNHFTKLVLLFRKII